MTKTPCFKSKQILKKIEIRIKTMPAGIPLLLSQLLSPRALCAIWKAGCITIIAADLHALYGTPDMTKRSVIECCCYDKQVLNEGRTIDFHPINGFNSLKINSSKTQMCVLLLLLCQAHGKSSTIKKGVGHLFNG